MLKAVHSQEDEEAVIDMTVGVDEKFRTLKLESLAKFNVL